MFDAYNRAASERKAVREEPAGRSWTASSKRHGFTLSADDRRSIDYIYRAFYSEGPDLRYSFPRQQVGARWFPNYMELMTTTDLGGQNHSYVATEENFRVLRDFERNNLLVPIVGDFGGDKAIQAVGRYLREHGATANYFYTSNVEQYLFQTDAWQRYYKNVATLPLDNNSTFIRAYFNMGFRFPPGIITPDLHSVQLLDPITEPAERLPRRRAADLRRRRRADEILTTNAKVLVRRTQVQITAAWRIPPGPA